MRERRHFYSGINDEISFLKWEVNIIVNNVPVTVGGKLSTERWIAFLSLAIIAASVWLAWAFSPWILFLAGFGFLLLVAGVVWFINEHPEVITISRVSERP